jgi:hypothetical protein
MEFGLSALDVVRLSLKRMSREPYKSDFVTNPYIEYGRNLMQSTEIRLISQTD